MARFFVLHNIERDPHETTNVARSNPRVVKELLSRLREHCRHRDKYANFVERRDAQPKLHDNVYMPWLEDGDELEWKRRKRNRNRFGRYFIAV